LSDVEPGEGEVLGLGFLCDLLYTGRFIYVVHLGWEEICLSRSLVRVSLMSRIVLCVLLVCRCCLRILPLSRFFLRRLPLS